MSIKTEMRKLMCVLTEEDLLQRGEEMAKTYMQVAALDMEKKRITARIKPLDERIEELVAIIDTKTEERDVECVWIYDWSIGLRTLTRTDNGEEIDTRKVQDWERQQHLELEAKIVCQKCDGEGQYIEDGIEDGGGEIYCDCPAGIALKAKEEANAGPQEKADQEATEAELKADCADAGAVGEQVKPLCATCNSGFCGIIGTTMQLTMFKCTGYVAPPVVKPFTDKTFDSCQACHQDSGCEKCCNDCTAKCHNEMICRVEEEREMFDLKPSLCAICKGECGDYPPGTKVSECAGFCGELNEDQIAWRDSVCKEWRDCNHADKCYGPANENGPDAPCICLKEEEAKAKKAEPPTLSELCAACHKAAGCDDCCRECLSPCNTKQRCTWPGAEAPEAKPLTALQEARTRRAKLIKAPKGVKK